MYYHFQVNNKRKSCKTDIVSTFRASVRISTTLVCASSSAIYVACLISNPRTLAKRMRSVGALAFRSIRMNRMVKEELIRLHSTETMFNKERREISATKTGQNKNPNSNIPLIPTPAEHTYLQHCCRCKGSQNNSKH